MTIAKRKKFKQAMEAYCKKQRIDEAQKILWEAWGDGMKNPQAFIRNRLTTLKEELK